MIHPPTEVEGFLTDILHKKTERGIFLDNIILISDLDGTLLNSKGELTEANKQAILSFQKDGGVFTIATSQPEHVVLPLLEGFPLTFPLILNNGALLYDPLDKKVISEEYMTLSPFIRKKLLKLVYGNPVSILFFIGDQIYTTRRDQNIRCLQERMYHTIQLLEKSTDFSKLMKIVVFSPSSKLLSQIKKSIFHYNLDLEAYFTRQDCLEILPFNVNKGKALLDLSQIYNLESWQIYTIGDNITDFSLFELSDRSYIVANSHPRLKLERFIHTVSNNQHALAQIIQDIRKERSLLSV